MDIIDLLQDPQRVAEIPEQEIPTLLLQVAGLLTTLSARSGIPANGKANPAEADQLLTVEEAAPKLSVSKDWLYRHANKLPFTVRLGHRQLRFSARGITKYIRQRQGL